MTISFGALFATHVSMRPHSRRGTICTWDPFCLLDRKTVGLDGGTSTGGLGLLVLALDLVR